MKCLKKKKKKWKRSNDDDGDDDDAADDDDGDDKGIGPIQYNNHLIPERKFGSWKLKYYS